MPTYRIGLGDESTSLRAGIDLACSQHGTRDYCRIRHRETNGQTVTPMSEWGKPMIVPEPDGTAFLIVGAIVLAALRRRRWRVRNS